MVKHRINHMDCRFDEFRQLEQRRRWSDAGICTHCGAFLRIAFFSYTCSPYHKRINYFTFVYHRWIIWRISRVECVSTENNARIRRRITCWFHAWGFINSIVWKNRNRYTYSFHSSYRRVLCHYTPPKKSHISFQRRCSTLSSQTTTNGVGQNENSFILLDNNISFRAFIVFSLRNTKSTCSYHGRGCSCFFYHHIRKDKKGEEYQTDLTLIFSLYIVQISILLCLFHILSYTIHFAHQER